MDWNFPLPYMSTGNSDLKRMKLYLTGFLVLCFFILLITIFNKRKYFDDIDGYGYYELAQTILHGDLHNSRQIQKWPPGYPVMLIGMQYLTGDFFLAAQLLAAIFGTLYILSSMLIAQQIFKNYHLTFLFGIMMLFRVSIWAALTFITDLPFAFFFQLSIYYLILGFQQKFYGKQEDKPKVDGNSLSLRERISSSLHYAFNTPGKYFFYAGLLGGASCLIRWTGIMLLVISIVLWLIPGFFSQNLFLDKIKSMIKGFFCIDFLIYFIAFFAIWSFWLIPNWVLFGSPFYSIIYQEPILWGPEYADSNLDAEQFSNLFEVILYDPILFLKNFKTVVLTHLYYYIVDIFIGEGFISVCGYIANVFYVLNLIIAIFGLYSIKPKQSFNSLNITLQSDSISLKDVFQNGIPPSSQRWMWCFNILIVSILFMGLVSLSVAYRRFLFPITPFSLVFFMIGIISIMKYIFVKWLHKKKELENSSDNQLNTIQKDQNRSKKIFISILLLLTLLNSIGGLYHVNNEMRQKRHNSVELKVVGDFLKSHTNSTKIVFARNNYWYYYNPDIIRGTSQYHYPRTSAELLDLDADFIVYAEGFDSENYPGMSFLFNSSSPKIPSNFEIIYDEMIPFVDYKKSNGISIEIQSEKHIVIYAIH